MIVLFTDFGLAGPYTGQVVAVLQREAPAAPVIPLFADAPAGAPKPFPICSPPMPRGFPPGPCCWAWSIPASAATRRALIVEANGQFYVGPDNGLFEIVLRRAGRPRSAGNHLAPDAAVGELSRPRPVRPGGGPPGARRAAARGPKRRAAGFADWPDDLAEIVYIDHYGNAMTGMRGEAVAPRRPSGAAPGSCRTHGLFGRAAGRGVLVRQLERARRDRRQRRPGRPVAGAVGREQGRGRATLNVSPACARRGTAARPG